MKKSPPAKTVLPVIFLIDVSDSMSIDSRIGSVNTAMQESIEALNDKMLSNTGLEIHMNVLKFGCKGECQCRWMYDEMSPLNAFIWENLEAEDNTPLGKAYFELDSKLSRSGFLTSPSGSYAPVIILITDGRPNNRKEAEEGLKRLNTNSWFVNADRMAIGVGLGEDDDTLFLDDFVRGCPNGRVFLEVSNAASLISSIEGIVINSAMIGATRLRTGGDEQYQDGLDRIEEKGLEEPVPPSEEEEEGSGGIEEPQP